MVNRHINEGAEVILGHRRTIRESFGEIRLGSISERGFTMGELAVVGVEGIGASE